MSRLKVRNNSGIWVDVCDQDIHFRNTLNNSWIKFKSGDRIRLPDGNWEQINCAVPCGGEFKGNGGGDNYPITQEILVEMGNGTGLGQFDLYSYGNPFKVKGYWGDTLFFSRPPIGSNGHLNKDESGRLVTPDGSQVHMGHFSALINKTTASPTQLLLRIESPYGESDWHIRTACPGTPYELFPISFENFTGFDIPIKFSCPLQDPLKEIHWVLQIGHSSSTRRAGDWIINVGPLPSNLRIRLRRNGVWEPYSNGNTGQFIVLNRTFNSGDNIKLEVVTL